MLQNFSEVGHTWCFLHIVNLIAKSVIRQFDIQKKWDNEHLDEAEQELHNLAGDVDLENEQAEDVMEQCQINSDIDMEAESDDNIKGWIDEMMLPSLTECEWVEEDIHPVKLILVKVRYQWYRHVESGILYLHAFSFERLPLRT